MSLGAHSDPRNHFLSEFSPVRCSTRPPPMPTLLSARICLLVCLYTCECFYIFVSVPAHVSSDRVVERHLRTFASCAASWCPRGLWCAPTHSSIRVLCLPAPSCRARCRPTSLHRSVYMPTRGAAERGPPPPPRTRACSFKRTRCRLRAPAPSPCTPGTRSTPSPTSGATAALAPSLRVSLAPRDARTQPHSYSRPWVCA